MSVDIIDDIINRIEVIEAKLRVSDEARRKELADLYEKFKRGQQPPQIIPPIVKIAKPTQTVDGFTNVILDGSLTTGTEPITFEWMQVGGQPGVSITDSNQDVATFVAPFGSDTDNVLNFKLTATNKSGSSIGIATVIIKASIPQPEPEPTLPDDGRTQNKGASKDATTWKIVHMRNDPNLFKIVDSANINVADQFHSQANAQQYIDYYIWKQGENPPPPPPPPPPQPPSETPYPIIGEPMASTQRGPTIRHYASGKPDDKTIEKNVKNIKFDNYQFVTYVTMNSIQHDDTISHKLGGTHMGSGWFDHGVSFGDGKGQTCLGTEKKHPSTQSCVIEGPEVGEILGKKVGIATTYFKKRNHTELWVDMGDGWKKQIEGTNVNNFNPNSAINEAQLRIDGFDDVPTIHSAFVTEIAEVAASGSAGMCELPQR